MAELPLAQGIERFKQNEDRMDRFTNGSDTQVITHSDGSTSPTIRKFLKDKDLEINTAGEGILAQAVSARNASIDAREASEDARDESVAARQDSISARDLSQAWAEGSAPGGPGTKSAKEWAQSISLPSSGSSDAGKALIVKPDASGYQLASVAITVSSRTEMKALPTAISNLIYLNESGREGYFRLKTGSPPVSDPREGLYIVSNTTDYYYSRVLDDEGWVKATWYGMVLDANYTTGVGTDNAPAIQAALDSLKNVILPPGNFRIATGDLIYKVAGQKMKGAGRRQTNIHITTSFSHVNGYILKLIDRCALEGVCFIFQQQAAFASGLRSDLVQYAFPVSCNGHNMLTLRDIGFHRSFWGFDLRGNTGTTIISDIDCGAWYRGFWIDGAYDSIYMSNIHHYPFGSTDNGAYNQKGIDIFWDGLSEAIYCGRMDDLHINGMLCSASKMTFLDTGLGVTTAELSDILLDSTKSSITVYAGAISITNLVKSRSGNDDGIRVAGGSLNVANFRLYDMSPTTGAPVVNVISGTGIFTNGTVHNLNSATHAFRCDAGFMSVKDSAFLIGANQARTVGVIQQLGGRVSVSGNFAQDSGTGTKTFIHINGSDAFNQVYHNSAPGWTVVAGATGAGVFTGNVG